MSIIIFETERLIVRQPTWADADNFYILNSDEDIVRFIRPPRTREESDAKLKERIENNNEDGKGLGGWIAETKTDNLFVGFLAMFILPGDDEVNLGYSLLRPQWGKGYATELAKAGVDYGFNKIGLKRMVATTDPAHVASQNILLKCGFRQIASFVEEGKELLKFEMVNR